LEGVSVKKFAVLNEVQLYLGYHKVTIGH